MKKSRYTKSQILAILKQAEAGTPVPELCREHGMSSATFYKWRSKYGGMDASLMARMKELEDENRRLKKMVPKNDSKPRSSRRRSQKRGVIYFTNPTDREIIDVQGEKTMCDLTKPEFQDDDKAREYLEALRWPHGPVCPHCGVEGNAYKLGGKSTRPGLYKCADCRKQFTVTVGTVFERSRVPLNKWLMAVHLMCASKKGISSHQVHRMIGVTYKTAWFMTHRIREAMNEGGSLLGGGGGTVEVDETFWGGLSKKQRTQGKKGRGYAHKMKVFTLLERDGKARSFTVPAVNAKTLAPIMEEQIAANANLMTDEASQYTKVGRKFASHGVVSHGIGEYVRGPIHTNTIEGFFSLLKRGLIGTFHHVGEQHLKRYAGEFDFRWNYRVKNGYSDKQRADVVLCAIGGKRLMYRQPAAVQ